MPEHASQSARSELHTAGSFRGLSGVLRMQLPQPLTHHHPQRASGGALVPGMLVARAGASVCGTGVASPPAGPGVCGVGDAATGAGEAGTGDANGIDVFGNRVGTGVACAPSSHHVPRHRSQLSGSALHHVGSTSSFGSSESHDPQPPPQP